jgi:organic hydroperoxide reductase OsmC/OhrA
MDEAKKAGPARKPKTFNFRVRLKWTDGRRGKLHPGAEKPELVAGSPVDFKGEPGNISPEDMMIGALAVCQMGTFVAFAAHKDFKFAAYEDSADGVMEVVERKLRFTRVTLRPRVTVVREEDRETALKLLQDAHNSCAISNSVNFEVGVEPTVVVG